MPKFIFNRQNIRKKDYLLLIKQYDKIIRRNEILIEDYEKEYSSREFSGEEINYYKKYLPQFKELVKSYKKNENIGLGTNLTALKKHNLNLYEGCVIYMYTAHNIFDHINDALKAYSKNGFQKMERDIILYRKLLNKALNKMPYYDNKTVYRDVHISLENFDEEFNKYKPGTYIPFYEFISSHQEKDTWGGTIFLTIKTKKNKSNGRAISTMSLVENEKEVLFKSPTKFLIEKTDKINKTIFLIEI